MQALFQRSFWAFLLVLSFVFSVLPLAPVNAASSAVKVVKDGKALSFDVPPQIIKGRTMVPYRVIAESLGGKVDWNATTRTVSVVKGGTTVKLTVGSTAAFTNNTKVTLDSAPVIVKGRTLVPVRFLSETLGLWVSWDGATNTVKIDSKVSIQTTLGAVTLNKVPQRVVVLDMYLLDIITSLGIKPIGVAQEDPTNKSLPAYLDRQINHPFTWVGDRKQPSTEVIASLKPDLIIGDVKRHKEALSVLNGIAPTVLFTGSGDDDWKLVIKRLGTAFNVDEKAKLVLSDYYKRVAAANAKARNLKVLPAGNYPKNQVRIFTPDSFTGDVLKEMGMTITFTNEGKPDAYVSREKLPEISTDVILLLESPKWTENIDIKTAPIWKDLPAVKAGKVYTVNLETWTFYRGPLAAKVIMDEAVKFLD